MVLGMAAPAERLPAAAMEAERGGVHEHHRQLAEQVAPAGEQLLLDLVLDAAGREGGGAGLLGVGQFLAKPGHRPIEVVQRKALRTWDLVVLHPALAGAIRARDHDPVQHGDEDRALDVELEAAAGETVVEHIGDTDALPQAPEQQRRADAATGDGAGGDVGKDDAAFAMSSEGLEEAIEGAGLFGMSLRPSGWRMRWRTRPPGSRTVSTRYR